MIKVDGVPGSWDPLVVPLVVIFRDIVKALIGQVTRASRCPPSRPCRARGGRCCPVLFRRSRRMTCPVRC